MIFDKWRQQWWEKKKSELEEFYSSVLKKFETELKEKAQEMERLNSESSEELAFLQKRIEDRKQELTKQNEDLKTQIRLIEAKASPDNVWVTAFSAGFEKAWDTMQPILMEGFRKAADSIRDDAINDTLSNLDPIIRQRAKELNGNPLPSDKPRTR